MSVDLKLSRLKRTRLGLRRHKASCTNYLGKLGKVFKLSRLEFASVKREGWTK